MKHLFITGKKQIGKSTIIQTALQDSNLSVGGFRTIRTERFEVGRPSVHFCSKDTGYEPSQENLLFYCDQSNTNETITRYNTFASTLHGFSSDILLMDELGPAEECASVFCDTIFSLLNGSTPIIGVLQEANSIFLKQISQHSNVNLLNLTHENYDDILEETIKWLLSTNTVQFME